MRYVKVNFEIGGIEIRSGFPVRYNLFTIADKTQY